jgi:hypothetical protein
VTRIKPTVAFNIPCAGVQKHIWEPIDDAEFSGYYGGGEYSLRGYALRDNGRSPKALTEPVPYRVAGHPNIEASLTEEDMMRPNPAPAHNGGSPFRRPAILTPQAATAEADMHARDLEHRETMDQRNREADEERRRRTEAREQSRERGNIDVVKLLAEAKEKEAERLKETYEAQLAAKGGGMAEMAELIKALKPGGEDQNLTRQHAEEIKQLSGNHKDELLRLTEQHRAEMTRLTEQHNAALHRVEDQARMDRERADGLARDSERRASETVKEAERRASEQIKETERRSDARIQDTQNQARTQYEDLRTRSEERISDQNRQWQQRFDDLKTAQEREISRKNDELNLMRTGLEGNMAVILQGKDAEIKRLQHDLRESRDLAEKNKDWLGKMGEFEKTAEKMGFSKGSEEGAGDEDVKTTAIKAGLGMLNRLPELVQSAGDAISKVRNPGVPPDVARNQARQGMVRGSMRTVPRTMGHAPPVLLAPLPFATEDGGYTPPPDQALPPPARRPQIQQEQQIAPLEQSPTQAIVATGQQQLPYVEQPVPQQIPQSQPQPVASQPPPMQQQAPAPQSMAPPPPATGGEEVDPITLQLIQGFLPSLANSFAQRESPDSVAQQIIQANGVEQARVALTIATIDQLLAAVALDTNPAFSVLKTRNGQKFLREIWRAAEHQVSQAPEQAAT